MYMEYKYGRWGVLPFLQICYERRTLLHVDAQINTTFVVRSTWSRTHTMCLYRLGLRRSCTYNPFSMCGTSPGVLRIATQTTDYRESSVFYRSPIYVVHSMHILQRVGMDATFGEGVEDAC